MRALITKAAIGTMIAGSALALAACHSTTTTTDNTLVTDLNSTGGMDGTMNDTMTGMDATMGNGAMMGNDTMMTGNGSMGMGNSSMGMSNSTMMSNSMTTNTTM